MECVLCHTEVTLFDLDAEGYGGMPAHEACASAVRAECAALLADCEALILAEPDPRRHRRSARSVA